MSLIIRLVLSITLLYSYNICAVDPLTAKLITIVDEIVSRYKRPTTVLFVGDHPFVLPHTIAQRHDVTCVLFAQDTHNTLENACTAANASNMVMLKHNVSSKTIRQINECEHVDLVVAHHDLGQSIIESCNDLVQAGDSCLLAWHGALPDSLAILGRQQNNSILATEDNHVIMLCHGPKKHLIKSCITNPGPLAPGKYVINSTYTTKTLQKFNETPTAWHRGINLVTFMTLGGIYPRPHIIVSEFERFALYDHGDMNICNFIIRGTRLKAIDTNYNKFSPDTKKAFVKWRAYVRKWGAR